MHLSTTLDCDLVAVEQADDLTLLIELEATISASWRSMTTSRSSCPRGR